MNISTMYASAYEAGFEAGRYGANNFNAHYSWFSTKEKMKEWQRGNDAGSKKREADNQIKKINNN